MRTSEQIKAEIVEKFGFFPPVFTPALQSPQVLENLWQHTLSAYVNNPLSALFKEKLFAYLSRYCAVPYCMISHSCSLRALGLKAREVLELLESPPPTETDIDKHLRVLAQAPDGLAVLSEFNAALEESLLYCSIFIALEQEQAEYCRSQLRRLLGVVNYQHLVMFVAYVKTCHIWIEAQPEIAYEADKRAIDHLDALIDDEPGLADFFHNYVERVRREHQSRAYRLAEITKRKRAEEQLLHNAFHDELTDLPNRALLIDRLGHMIEGAKQGEDCLFAVLFLDLDRFKIVNDSLGHSTGNQLLIAITYRLESCLHPRDTVARLGGDEFAILLEDIKDASDATRMAEQIQKALKLPFNLNEQEVFITASIGIALSATCYNSPENLLRDAEIAMYRAKTLGKARYEIFTTNMHAQVITRLRLETDLRRAIEREEFQLHYQPIISLKTLSLTGFEALVRWQHPERGLVSPAEFIPVAEETGLIILLGLWVLHEACQQMYIWQRQFPQIQPLSISVNLSIKQFLQPDLIEQIDQILKKTGLDSRSLRLEITESCLMENGESATTMSQLRDLGVHLHIDDFGTGYSSLSYLHRFPVDTLKIDRSFISGMGVNGENSEIVQTIVALAHNLGMTVTAEGVERAEQLTQLRILQCEYAQGYFFSKPVDSKVAEALIQNIHQGLAVCNTTDENALCIANQTNIPERKSASALLRAHVAEAAKQELEKEITERKLAEAALRQRVEQERLVAAIAVRIRQSLNLEEILHTTVVEVQQFLQADRVLIYRFESDWSGIVAVESVAPGWIPILDTKHQDFCFVQTRGLAYKQGCITAREDIYTAGLTECYLNLMASFQVRAHLVVPILEGEQLWGLLIAHQCSGPRQWQQLDVDLLKQLATQVAIAIHQSKLYQQLEKANQQLQLLAFFDSLTQVANRRHFDQYLDQEWQRMAREKAPLSLILCDIDYFKTYNDTYGHQSGDICLQQVAEAISVILQRTTDLVARYGGEEFAVILPNTKAEGAVQIAETIRSQVQALKITHAHSLLSQYVTLSLGVASFVPSQDSSPAMLIARADRVLYQAKAQGRDRVVMSAYCSSPI